MVSPSDWGGRDIKIKGYQLRDIYLCVDWNKTHFRVSSQVTSHRVTNPFTSESVENRKEFTKRQVLFSPHTLKSVNECKRFCTRGAVKK
ncbi:MAG: hypothetical protein ACI8Z1_000311 [Candidatus Azotimanducaceae bacterium]|jgi:hypothetical protein